MKNGDLELKNDHEELTVKNEELNLAQYGFRFHFPSSFLNMP